jgi:hypothetical protein
MYTIATLDQLRRRLGLDSGADDARLLAALQAASAQIERLAGRRFTPRFATLEHNINPRRVTELLLDDDLLALESLVCSDGTVIPPENVLLLPDGDGPAGAIWLVGGRAFTWAETPLRAAAVTGVWGWSLAWRESGDTVQDAALTADDTIITVDDADAADIAGDSPRFQVGHLLRIGDEYVRVLAVIVNTQGDDTLTVLRGVNGTQPAAHDQGTPIDTFQPAPDVEMLVLRWAAWLYKEPDSRTSGGLPPALVRDLAPLRRVGVKV